MRSAPAIVAMILSFTAFAVPGVRAQQDEAAWSEVRDGAGKFDFKAPGGWRTEAWEKGGRRGVKARPPACVPFEGGLFGVEYYSDPKVSESLTSEELARIFYDYYVGQKASAVGEAEAVQVDGASGILQRFVLEVERELDGGTVVFSLEYRVISVKKGSVAYVVNLAAESRILEANGELCRKLVEGVRLTPDE
ncbi:MAG: hypothetical protein HY720_28025 [Planctomycetes bacterium]|nr:hypothetical protein [Planctomycetota bacterium]